MSTTQSLCQQRMAFLGSMIDKQVAFNRMYGGGYNSGCSCGSSSGTNNDVLTQLLLYSLLSNGGLGNSGVTASRQSNIGSVKNGMNEFANIDSSGNGKISRAEYQNYYMRQREMESGEIIDKNHPDYAKYKKEANNMFNALSKNGYISEKRFQKMLNAFDRYSDGTRDGYIDKDYMQECLGKIKREGRNAEILNGKTLSQLIDMEA